VLRNIHPMPMGVKTVHVPITPGESPFLGLSTSYATTYRRFCEQ